MGNVLRYRGPKGREESTALIGMVIFLGSWAMMFASLFFAYAFIRSRALAWPPAGVPRLPLLLPAANTVVLALSSVALELASRSLRSGNARASAIRILLGAVLGAAFIALQTLLWLTLHARGLTPSSGGPYSSVFYGLTWLHAVHVLVGIGGLAAVCRRAFRGEFSAARHLPVRLWTMYWHFVGIVWAVMFVTIFVV